MAKIIIAYQDGKDFFVRYSNGKRIRINRREMTEILSDNPKLEIGSCREVKPTNDEIIWR
jgi:hypothetical protein